MVLAKLRFIFCLEMESWRFANFCWTVPIFDIVMLVWVCGGGNLIYLKVKQRLLVVTGSIGNFYSGFWRWLTSNRWFCEIHALCKKKMNPCTFWNEGCQLVANRFGFKTINLHFIMIWFWQYSFSFLNRICINIVIKK